MIFREIEPLLFKAKHEFTDQIHIENQQIFEQKYAFRDPFSF